VDFQRDVRKGDGFELVYEQDVMKSGEIARNGRILFAAFDTRFGPKAYYHFTPEDGRADHFDAKGHSARRLLMRTPINGARLSSGFGKRRHPILGYTRMHNGVDFAAPTGTPILAAGDGRIDRASWYGGYGRFVRIEHANGYKTAYAHLSRYGPGIKKGVRVKQGQVIGYLGSSGLATGPHLHYEVLKDGRRINPRSLRAPTGKILEGAELEAFQTARLGFQTRLARLRKDPVDTPTTLASEATASQPATPPSQ
jgi:murein DD-endopeptidase MepM/ murein hydrolase activator NlpD